jgi:hypothetical protein
MQMYWFGKFLERLQQGSPCVVGLLANNPFPDKPPRDLRVLTYRYKFTEAKTR